MVNIPILGKYLFGNMSKDKQSEQLMIALIPHIVRRPDINGLDLRGIAAGTDQEVKLSFGAETGSSPAPRCCRSDASGSSGSHRTRR